MVSIPVPARKFLAPLKAPLPWIVLGLSLLATGIGSALVREGQLRLAETDFKLRTDRASGDLSKRMLVFEQILRGGVALFGVTGTVSRQHWREYVERLRIGESFPGVQGIGFAGVVSAEGKARHVDGIRAEGFPNYDIRPPGTREIYTPIVYIEPFSDRNSRAFGYDMFAEPVRRLAMERARDDGTTAVSGKVRLVQETDDKGQAGLLMYLPVYRGSTSPASVAARRATLAGYVYAPFRMNDLMAGVLDQTMNDIDVKIFDGTDTSQDALLFDRDETPQLPGGLNSARLSVASSIHVSGRPWTLQYAARPRFLASRDDQKSLLVLAGGGLISLLLFGLTWSVSRTRDRAVSLAAQMSANLQENEQRFTGIFHSAMDAIITTDEHQKIVLFNPAAEHAFRCTSTQAIGAPLSRFVPERFRATHAGHVERFGTTGVSDRQMGKQRDLFGLRADGEEFPLEASISQTMQNGKRLYTVMLRDITARKSAEEALRNSEQRFRGLIEASPEAIYIHQDEKIIFVNHAAQVLFGATNAEQLLGRPIYALFHPESEPAVRQAMLSILGGVPPPPIVERKIVRLDGEVRFVEIALSDFENASGHAVQGMMRDVTERHHARAELERSHAELRQLGNALETAQEEERKRIARELHDDLGQTLTVLKMDMSSLKSKLTDARTDPAPYAGLLDDIERMDSQLNHTVQSVRRISADLRPVMLDDLGLATALETLMKQVSRSSNIRCSFDLNPDRLSINKRLATPLFRMAQEALNNVVKHAQASEVRLSLYRDAIDSLILEIRDNGKGLTPEDRRKPASFGLIGMRERAYALGGDLKIDSQPGNGTMIRVTIPNIGNESAI
jgi:PAS domain S-box-containing protein